MLLAKQTKKNFFYNNLYKSKHSKKAIKISFRNFDELVSPNTTEVISSQHSRYIPPSNRNLLLKTSQGICRTYRRQRELQQQSNIIKINKDNNNPKNIQSGISNISISEFNHWIQINNIKTPKKLASILDPDAWRYVSPLLAGMSIIIWIFICI